MCRQCGVPGPTLRGEDAAEPVSGQGGLAGHQDGAAITDAAGAGIAELGKEVLAPEHPAGTPTHGPAQETPGAPVEEQGGIPIPSAGLLQVTERRPWTRAREQGREKKHLSDPELPPGPPDAFLPAERPREP
ncbi:PREDICTED: dysbindin domain-containing protein 1 [Haliaeetus leucocephalus]|uniref:dysbindin domain-containing protein 1 n=1 Tax=Haliaeetus leucocephalus TaxID=52644 RepID=UPI00053CAEDD|nr:PREDICTED: dysbindin domain-containing protein 1 [Haliaeetus leucocephalus]